MVAAKTSPTRKPLLKPLEWKEINEPGAYVELSTGVLYRVPQEALTEGAAPLVEKQNESGPRPVPEDGKPVFSKFVRLSANPFIFSLGARMLCVEHDIRPRF